MSERKILLLGGGGHCRSVLDCLLSSGDYDQIGIVDNESSSKTLGIDVVGNDDDLPRLLQEGWTEAFITVGSIGSTAVRRRLYDMVSKIGFVVPSVIDLTAVVGREVEIGPGVFIGKNAVINSGSTIGCCAIINTGAVIEHDCKIGQFAHISSGAVLCGQVSVGDDTHVGAGSVVRQGIDIGHDSLIGIGSVVVKDIPDGVKAYGNPCRVVTT